MLLAAEGWRLEAGGWKLEAGRGWRPDRGLMDAGGCGGWRLEVSLEHERRAQRRLAFADSVRARVWSGLGLGLGLADSNAVPSLMPLSPAAGKALGGSCGAKPDGFGPAAAMANAGSRLWL